MEDEERRVALTLMWVSAGHPDQDIAVVEEIVRHAMGVLDGYSPKVVVVQSLGGADAADDERLDAYLGLIERERECRPSEAMLADEVRRLRLLVGFGEAIA